MLKNISIVLLSFMLSFLIWGCSKSTDELIQDLRSNSSRERTKAGVTLMGRHGDHETVQKLIDLLDDKDERVVFIAIQILGSLADTSAIKPLGDMLDHPDPDFRARACYSLGSIGHESAIHYLVKALDDPDSGVRHDAVTGLGYMPHSYVRETAGYIYKMFRDEADSVRAAAIHSLYNYRNVKNSGITSADMAITLNDKSDLVRYVSVQALGGGFADTTTAGDFLIEMLKDENKYVRIETIISLQKLKYEKAVPSLKEMYDTATVDEEYAISEAIKIIADETFPPSLEDS
ncbi:MAG: HEAT repeat domain-containing protein [Candidatus Latescibacteria bacterium]|nr:HEAT repeat domain-containing protein [Candidatus Latescibacterota bacterium]